VLSLKSSKKTNKKANVVVLVLFAIFIIVLGAGLIKDGGFGGTSSDSGSSGKSSILDFFNASASTTSPQGKGK
jgi:hypothetical protein